MQYQCCLRGRPPGETDDTFKSVLNRWLRHYFPSVNKHPAAMQKKYMRCMLRKPKTVQVKQVFTRLHIMNGMLKYFPSPDNTPFSEQEMIDIIISMVPGVWRTSMAKMNFEPFEHNIIDVQTTLEKLKMIEAYEALSVENNKKRK